MRTKISCIILAKNEEKNLSRAIQSVKFVDEIIVIDDKSADATLQVARSAGAKVISRDLNADFAAARNFAIDKTANEWILFLDADEIVTEELRNEIELSVIGNPVSGQSDRLSGTSSYYIKRRDFWWGRELRYGETMKARKKGIVRLVKKDAGRFVDAVHETFLSDKPTGNLCGFIDHHPHQSTAEFLKDINYYSSLRAKQLYDQKATTNIFQIVFFPFFKFVYTYIILLGALDGSAGFVYSFMMSFHSFLVRGKLYLMKKVVSRGNQNT